jgi:hypothetical protein
VGELVEKSEKKSHCDAKSAKSGRFLGEQHRQPQRITSPINKLRTAQAALTETAGIEWAVAHRSNGADRPACPRGTRQSITNSNPDSRV